MSQRIIILLIALISQGIQAQNCAVNFWTGFAFPNGGIVLGVYPDTGTTGIAQSYIWSNGIADTSAIHVNQPGNYCVTVTFDDGCTATNCYTYTPACNVGINAIPDEGLLSAGTWGVPPYSFLWSTGATGSAITPAVAGAYAVTMTDAAGCTSTNSFVVDGQDSCVLLTDISNFGNNQSTLSVGAFDQFGNTATYLWSTGATTPVVTVTPGTYCVTVTLPNCNFTRCLLAQQATCGANIVIDTAAQTATAQPGGGTAPYTYAWSNGSTAASIALPAGWTEVCVSVTDATGCVGIDCAENAQYPCTVYAYAYPDSSGTYTAQAYAAGGTPPYAFLWSNGSTGVAISPLTGPAVYCVTMTDAAGCTASDCVDLPGPSCSVSLQTAWDAGQNTLTLTADTDSPTPTYQWSNGVAAPAITVSDPGVYCVTVTGADGCTGADCFQFINDNHLRVWVTLADSADDVSAEIFVIQYDTAQGGILTAIDTVETDANGFVHISGLPAGEYLIKAALLPASGLYDQYLPTYYDEVLFWDEATPVLLVGHPATQPANVLIRMIPGQNPGGPGFIGGLVTQGANFQGGIGSPENSDEPMAGAQVILRTQDGTPVMAVRTQADGRFEFGQLPWGAYIVSIDVPGIVPQHQTVVIGPDQPAVSDMAFTMQITSSTTGLHVSGQPLRVRPNPATESVVLEVPEGVFDLTLTDGQGRPMQRMQVQGPNAEIDVLSLPPGLYFLQLQNGRYSAAAKLIKQ